MEMNSICFKETRKKFEEFLFALGHSKGTMETYQWMLSRLERFMVEKGFLLYSPEVGMAFCEKESSFTTTSIRHLNRAKLTTRRLNDFLNGKFNLLSTKKNPVPDCHIEHFQNFLENLRLKGLRGSSIQGHYYSGVKMLRAFYLHKVYDLSKIQPQEIYDVFTESNDKRNIGSTLRSFLRYLFKSGVLTHDFSGFVPAVRGNKPVPSVYTKEEIQRLLSSIDTNCNSGKRNYAIILLALRLGIRSGDIVNLKISDIDFRSNMIEFVQKKTCVPQRLELLPELKEAICKYLSGGRPDTEHPNLFISVRPPFRPISVMAVTSLMLCYMKRSDIVTGHKKRGGHALRMTLASELVSEKVPYDVVRKILGHEDTKSMKHYVKFDVGMLRSCALEIPPLGGLYAEYVNNRKGGREK
ncbi:MAG: tyrosine-type recombinase/integrase [Dysgonamonadaceae bacterium]|jgi:integrase|nr:tyrosine-type recombinase/integrase [Dysgonamonadaceae bacterium]